MVKKSYHWEGYHVKEPKKLCQNPVSKVTLHFVWGHLTRKQTVTGDAALYYSFTVKIAKWVDELDDQPFRLVDSPSPKKPLLRRPRRVRRRVRSMATTPAASPESCPRTTRHLRILPTSLRRTRQTTQRTQRQARALRKRGVSWTYSWPCFLRCWFFPQKYCYRTAYKRYFRANSIHQSIR